MTRSVKMAGHLKISERFLSGIRNDWITFGIHFSNFLFDFCSVKESLFDTTLMLVTFPFCRQKCEQLLDVVDKTIFGTLSSSKMITIQNGLSTTFFIEKTCHQQFKVHDSKPEVVTEVHMQNRFFFDRQS